MKRLHAAVHEAAHAVIADAFGYRVTRVVLDTSGSWVAHKERGRRVRCPVETALVVIAGSVAEHIAGYQPRDDWSEEDWIRLRVTMGLSRYSIHRVVVPEARRLVRHYWGWIRALADAFLREEWPVMLRGRRLVRMIEEARTGNRRHTRSVTRGPRKHTRSVTQSRQ